MTGSQTCGFSRFWGPLETLGRWPEDHHRRWVFLACLMVMFILSACAAGCGGVSVHKKKVQHEPVERELVPASIPSISVQTTSSAIELLKSWIGERNQVTLRDAAQINQSGLRIELEPGTNIEYQMLDGRGLFNFGEPRPTVHAKLAGIPLGVPLNQVVLLPDGTGSGLVQVGPFEKRTPPFRWLDVPGSPAGQDSGAPQKFVRNQPCHCGCNKTPCDCQDCRLSSAAAITERLNRGVVITMDSRSCPPCKKVKEQAIPELVKSGWLVNKGPQSHLLVLDWETDAAAIDALRQLPGAKAVSTLPAFVRIEGGKVTAQHEGELTATQIAEFVYPSIKTQAPSGQVCPRCGKIHQ